MSEFARPGPAPEAHDRIVVPSLAHTPGRPLEPVVAARFGDAFGHDFSRVRVHSTTRAERSADHHDALAYTIGNDIVFGTGQYQPTSESGLRLIGHELAHVVQHERGPGTGRPSPRHEAEADRAVDAALAGRTGIVLSGGPTVLAANSRRGASVHANNPDTAVLHGIMSDLLNSLPEGTRRTVERNKTVAIAVVNDGEGFRTLVYTVSGNWTSRELDEAASRLNIERWNPYPRASGRGAVGAPGDAEQLMFEAATENVWEVETIVTSRDFCADCVEAVRAEMTPRGLGAGGGSTGGGNRVGGSAGGRSRTSPLTESTGTPEPAPFEGTPGLNPAHGAMEGAALMINQALARIAVESQVEAARKALEAMQPAIAQMRREGKWVIASAVMSEPRMVDLLRDIVTTPDQLPIFQHVSLRWGMSRAEAEHPPARFEAAPPAGAVRHYEPLPESRRLHGYDIAVYPPIVAPTADEARAGRLAGQIRNPEVARRYLDVLVAVRNPQANHSPTSLRALIAPFDPHNPVVLDDMAIMTAILQVSGTDLALMLAAFPGVLRSRAQINADRSAPAGR